MLTRRRKPTGVLDPESGATMIVAILVMLVLTTLSLAVLTRTLSLLASTRMGQDYEAALAAADAGLADARFKLDQFGPTNPAPGPAATGTTDTGTYAYTSEKVDDATYIVRSRGSVGKAHHAISARVTRTVKFPFALFAKQNLTLDGKIKWPADSGPVPVGSNATTVCNGSVGGSLVARATNNKDCPGFEPLAQPVPLPPGPAPAGALPCPADGVFTGYVTGTFVCRQDVAFSGSVTPSTLLAIYILPSLDGVDHALDLGGAFVNVAGPAANVQIYKAGNAPVVFDSGNTSDQLTFRGVIYAPDSRFEVGGGGKWMMGSMMFNEVKLNGAPNFTIAYDGSLETLYGNDWITSRYTEIPSSDPGLPAL